ncbi:hypothetical protein EYF80_029884 [Liparis tanakae]|uniref:Uncharacterized protein n=1 Tax=Liparis tanakae TaxID=230148 RepID=A0A4Z2H219_9TELE|nr:hypothetical protein EYF80_029884 [Liparis tanakae]
MQLCTSCSTASRLAPCRRSRAEAARICPRTSSSPASCLWMDGTAKNSLLWRGGLVSIDPRLCPPFAVATPGNAGVVAVKPEPQRAVYTPHASPSPRAHVMQQPQPGSLTRSGQSFGNGLHCRSAPASQGSHRTIGPTVPAGPVSSPPTAGRTEGGGGCYGKGIQS